MDEVGRKGGSREEKLERRMEGRVDEEGERREVGGKEGRRREGRMEERGIGRRLEGR